MQATLFPAKSRSIEAAFGPAAILGSGLWGFEREALRVDRQGRLATSDHPFPPERQDITVDFAENQIELVSRPMSSIDEARAELRRLHRIAYAALGDELLWPLSVPGRWDEPERLRPARFGGAPEREGSREYRQWLLARYGRARQAITGLHYNFSFRSEFWDLLKRAEHSPEEPRAFANRRYIELARNFARYRFLPVYLFFSASPVLDRRFAADLLDRADPPSRAMGKFCMPSTASLRLGPLGYRLGSEIARKVDVRFDSLEEYILKLDAATTPRGEASLLRSEAEFYAPVRPKASFPGSKASLDALRTKGIEYLEFRIFDLDPLDPIGIGADEALWIHLFILACLFMPSPLLKRDVASEEPLALAASACSLDQAACASMPRLARTIGGAGAPVLAMMSRLARLLPPEYELALSRSREILAGRRRRSVERFGELALRAGGGLEAGLELARAHKAKIEESASWIS